jgi:hypothetical protein
LLCLSSLTLYRQHLSKAYSPVSVVSGKMY